MFKLCGSYSLLFERLRLMEHLTQYYAWYLIAYLPESEFGIKINYKLQRFETFKSDSFLGGGGGGKGGGYIKISW